MMPLEQRDKELAAIGASIGANCDPCITHHLAAGRKAGLSQPELDTAVATAHAVRREAVELLAARIDVLLGHGGDVTEPNALVTTTVARELVALGVSVGANAHGLLEVHVRAALAVGLEPHQIRSALKMAGYVQQNAAAITAEEVKRVVAERVGTPAEAAATA